MPRLLRMGGKYSNVFQFMAAALYREFIRQRVARLVAWEPLRDPEEGCTAIIGMCSRLPSVLAANLECLQAGRWPALRSVLIAVDNGPESLPAGFEAEIRRRFPALAPEFLYYSREQVAVAETLKLPYVFSWLSWCLCLARVKTRDVLIHDYDALILGNSLARRHARFRESGAKMQGVRWYEGNGVLPGHRLATTFEAFVDAGWLRDFEPVMLFNKVRYRKGRSVDYDTLLDLQENHLVEAERDIAPMEFDDLVHPSQMIHQYTMFRKFPGAPLPCFSVVMIPFFSWLGGDGKALRRAIAALAAAPRDRVDLIGDGTLFNLSRLSTAAVDWMLKQMLQILVARRVAPFPEVLAYGSALYRASGTPQERVWVGDFLPPHRRWLERAGT